MAFTVRRECGFMPASDRALFERAEEKVSRRCDEGSTRISRELESFQSRVEQFESFSEFLNDCASPANLPQHKVTQNEGYQPPTCSSF